LGIPRLRLARLLKRWEAYHKIFGTPERGPPCEDTLLTGKVTSVTGTCQKTENILGQWTCPERARTLCERMYFSILRSVLPTTAVRFPLSCPFFATGSTHRTVLPTVKSLSTSRLERTSAVLRDALNLKIYMPRGISISRMLYRSSQNTVSQCATTNHLHKTK
jgi:hypothetical protein